ncbi:LRR receptor serine/threonine-protein kinase [Spatholobus suberectus]|nr:LRR receptor serine/threonine-protein kinase [Spatholobus suberectus]
MEILQSEVGSGVEDSCKQRYSLALEDVVQKIYNKMDLLLFANEDEAPNSLLNSEDINKSLNKKHTEMRVWAPKQKGMKTKTDLLQRVPKRKERKRASYGTVCETPMTGNKCSSPWSRGSYDDNGLADGSQQSGSVSKGIRYLKDFNIKEAAGGVGKSINFENPSKGLSTGAIVGIVAASWGLVISILVGRWVSLVGKIQQTKGVLSDGDVIAVKQLSSKLTQGNREFVNEIGMISALQHPNLVKLYGCCIEI